jgi:hypothetical protein
MLRVGIVGSGFGGAVHAPAYALHPRFEVVAIASPTNAERVARERKIPHAFRSVGEMLAGVELDVVSVRRRSTTTRRCSPRWPPASTCCAKSRSRSPWRKPRRCTPRASGPAR